jgi:glycopeptide antibiotics resistance protein
VKTSLLNILLFVPFGLGLPFITKQSMKKVVMYGALFSLSIELLQLLTGFFAGVTFRVADVNDLLFNTIGAAIGYMLVRGFKRIWHS